MTQHRAVATVLFADIVGSTRLYDRLGDIEAQRTIAEAFATMSESVHRHGGVVIKTIGDEIMCRFDRVDDAALAARDIQETFHSVTARTTEPIAIRIGFHHGPVIFEDTDVFGDAVNIAARMADIAKREQIITTEDSIEAIEDAAAVTVRRFDRVRVKGKSAPLTVYEVVWMQENLTQIFSTDFPTVIGNPPKTLHIVHQTTNKEMTLDSPAFLLGRNRECDLVVQTPTASRIHARIEPRRGKFVLLDTSTNGTYARTNDERELYLRREELVIQGDTTISLGAPVDSANGYLIHLSL